MRRLCPSAEALDRAQLPEHSLAFTRYSRSEKGGVADVIQRRGASVWGVIYRINQTCLGALDRYEDAPRAYRREKAIVLDASGQQREAFVYVANRTGDFAPSRSYRDRIVRGARERGLPDDYLRELEAVTPHS
jgi:gamma-glutamylcyclotransferase (GGCT)/AIG2-like uncharacterized protein YtfP